MTPTEEQLHRIHELNRKSGLSSDELNELLTLYRVGFVPAERIAALEAVLWSIQAAIGEALEER
jgi:hypothetical protein